MPPLHDRLTLTREINRSGIATVWEGYDTGLDRKVLVKAIHPQYARDNDLRTRFEREARAIARISHPNVVQIFDLEIDEDKLRLILEFVEGQTLSSLIKERGKLPAKIAISIAHGILEGLKAAHADGVIHRDLKPDNILISKKGDAKITDFGLATLKDQPTVTMEGAVLGTPTYMSPEQAMGSALSENTDLFTAGLILFEMLTGKRVIEGESMREALNNVINYQPPDLNQYTNRIPQSIMPLLNSLLAREPGNRLKTATETSEALQAAVPAAILTKAKVESYLQGTYEGASDELAELNAAAPDSGTSILPAETASAAESRGQAGEEVTLAPEEPEVQAETQEPERKPAHVDRKHSKLNNWIPWLAGAFIILSGFTIWLFLPPQQPREVVETPIDTTIVEPEDSTALPPDTSIIEQPFDTTAVDTTTTEPIEQPQAKPPTTKPTEQQKPVDTLEVKQGALGWLQVQCKPWARVYIADSLWGTTPLSGPLKLSSGIHSIMLLNDEINQPVSRNVEVLPDTTLTLDIDLYDYVAKIRIASVKPWADVYVDGIKELRTPSNRVIFKPLGTHTITLEHPDYRPHTIERVFNQGDPIYEIRVDLAQI